MADGDKDFQDSIDALAEKRRRDEHDDYHHAFAGREVGRMARFLPREARGPQSKERRERERALQTALDILLANSAYAALHGDVTDFAARAETAAEIAMQEAEQDLAGAEESLRDTVENANKLPDGTAVFKRADGTVRTEDGCIVEGDELDGIVWRDDAPTYEDYLRRKAAVEEARKRIEDIRRYQVDVLGHARDRLNDTDNPPSIEELERIQKNIEDRMPPSVESKLDPDPVESTPDPTTVLDMGVPDF